MTPRMICALSGACLGLAAQHEMLSRWPVFSAGAMAVGVFGLAVGLTRRDGLRDVSDAVLYEAHRAAQRLSDHAGADAIRGELDARAEARREVGRG
jgi:cobalamin synthase